MKDIEKIRKQIEQRIKYQKNIVERYNGDNTFGKGSLDALQGILSFLSYLEKEEKPMEHKDIDTEIGHWLDRLDDKYCMLVPLYSIEDIKDTARYFAQWGAEHLKQ